VYDLTGPRSQDMDAIAAEYARGLGRPIRYVDVPPAPWEEALARGASTPHLAAHLIAMAALHRENRYDRHTDTVERLTGTPPMSVEEFARRHAADFTPDAPGKRVERTN
jgi:nucleotide-binding universal stress UspA family protein